MRSLVAINPSKKNSMDYTELGIVKFGQEDILFGTVELEQPFFDTEDPKNREYVLVRVTAFSCNYRDKALLLNNYNSIKGSDRLFVPFGSEFSANIVAIGKDVHEFKVGDSVMSDCSYPDSGKQGVLPGIATNFASLGWLRLHKKKIIKIPKSLSDSEAACFSLGSQTASGMIRRSGILENGGNPLVFSARSSTSLFIIQQLLSYGITPICLSTSEWSDEEIQKIYPSRVELVSNAMNGASSDIVKQKITHVFDPFFDMNIGDALYYLQTGGTYVTCGLRDQHPLLSNNTPSDAEPMVRGALQMSIFKNVSILGNCLGSKEDLEKAIQLQNKIIIDQEYQLEKGVDFVQRSFFDSSRFGKCVLFL
ncbi:alcohol dehydrogenase catalytic domain-containing protein [Bacillus sp. FSL K6-2822]|uniref:alcohol dehydrogenase catalytic domain-containing protein n=1 Tax=Bacillus sp. FSL K6-2822 TaxID=2921478 RepID=UPI0030FBA8A9